MEKKKQKKRKTIQELTITDDFLFGAVMTNEDNCRVLLEMILDIPIDKVEVNREKSLIYNPEYKGIRLDVFAKDEFGTRYDVEIQVRSTPIMKRSRYYHSQMDMEMLSTGMEYIDLPDSYVIFICCYDPWDKGIYRYTIENSCRECPELDPQDGTHTIILNNRGNNPEDIPEKLVRFLEFTRKTLAESEEASDDPYITQLQKSIREIKSSRELGERYMKLQDMLKEEWEDGRKEGLAEGLEKGIAEGLEKGIAEGLEKGIAEGLEKGIAEGLEKGIKESIYIQKVLSNSLSVKQAAEMLDISVEELQNKISKYETLQTSI